MSSNVRIPADVEMPDKVLGPFTLRQVVILAAAGLVFYGAWQATRTLVPTALFLAVAAPVAAAVAGVVLGRRDGISLDVMLLAAIRQKLIPRRRVATPASVQAAPDWLAAEAHNTDTTASRRVRGGGDQKVGPLRLPAEQITDSGVVDLGNDGLAAIAVCSTVNFTLRTPQEQSALIAAFGSWLHSLTAPAQLLVRTERLDLSEQIAELRDAAGGLPHPALEHAAAAHAEFLTDLDRRSDLLRRQVLLVLREGLRPAGSTAASAGAGIGAAVAKLLGRPGSGRAATTDAASREAAETRLLRRLSEAVSLLGAAGIVVTPLDASGATTVLASACDPDTLLPPGTPLAGSSEVITVPTDLATGSSAARAAGADGGFHFDYHAPDSLPAYEVGLAEDLLTPPHEEGPLA